MSKSEINRIPLNGTFELTGRCNLNCKMCLVHVDQPRIQQLELQERTAEEWIDMAHQAFDAGTLGLLLTGGEIMLRPDFTRIYEAIARMGFLLTIYTNATLVTDEIMDVLQQYPPHKIGVTMYGASNETYHRLCGCSDGYDRFVRGVEQLTSLPSVFDIRTTLVRDNVDDLPAMKDFTRNTFGNDKVLHISRSVFNSIRGGISCPVKVRLTPEENIKIVYSWLYDFKDHMQQETITQSITLNQLHMLRHKMPDPNAFLFEHCGAGIHQYAINWAGRMYACEMADQGFTEPFETGFSDAWGKLPEKYPRGKVIEKCQSCKYSALCDACPASRLAETGDWFGIPKAACEEAKIVHDELSQMGILAD